MSDVRNTFQQAKRTGVAVGPLVVSKSNPRYFAVGSSDGSLGLPDRLARQQQLVALAHE